MNSTTEQATGARPQQEGEAFKSLHELHVALANVLEHGVKQYPAPQREQLVRELERITAEGGSIQYLIRCMPGEGMRVRCYAASPNAAEDPVLLFQVDVGGAGNRRLLN